MDDGLGCGRSARGEGQHGRVVGVRRVGDRFDLGRGKPGEGHAACRGAFAQGDNRLDHRQGALQLGYDRADIVALESGKTDDALGLAVGQQRLEILPSIWHRQHAGHRTHGLDTQEDRQELGAVGKLHADYVAPSEAKTDETRSKPLGGLMKLGVSQGAVGSNGGWRIGRPRGPVRDPMVGHGIGPPARCDITCSRLGRSGQGGFEMMGHQPPLRRLLDTQKASRNRPRGPSVKSSGDARPR